MNVSHQFHDTAGTHLQRLDSHHAGTVQPSEDARVVCTGGLVRTERDCLDVVGHLRDVHHHRLSDVRSLHDTRENGSGGSYQ